MSRLVINNATVKESDKAHSADNSGDTYTVKIERKGEPNGDNEKTYNTNA